MAVVECREYHGAVLLVQTEYGDAHDQVDFEVRNADSSLTTLDAGPVDFVYENIA